MKPVLKVPKNSIIRLQLLKDKQLNVRFAGGRQITGILKSYDQKLNLVLDKCFQKLPVSQLNAQQSKRYLGFLIVRGAQILTIATQDGYEEIQNPFDYPQQEPVD